MVNEQKNDTTSQKDLDAKKENEPKKVDDKVKDNKKGQEEEELVSLSLFYSTFPHIPSMK